jgi:hypothetical protein
LKKALIKKENTSMEQYVITPERCISGMGLPTESAISSISRVFWIAWFVVWREKNEQNEQGHGPI